MNDLISRQAAIANAISGRTREVDGEKWIRVSEVRESIKILPPAEPVRHGKWVEYPIADGMNQCSECGVLRFGESNYCPNCGARMDEE